MENNAVQVFNNDEFGNVRVVEENGKFSLLTKSI